MPARTPKPKNWRPTVEALDRRADALLAEVTALRAAADALRPLTVVHEVRPHPSKPRTTVIAEINAPHGYKKDGTPRKRPAPSAEHMQAALAGAARSRRAKKRAAKRAAEENGAAYATVGERG